MDRELGERLMVFQSADKVAHKLTSHTLSVQSETFLALLSTINTSMVYWFTCLHILTTRSHMPT